MLVVFANNIYLCQTIKNSKPNNMERIVSGNDIYYLKEYLLEKENISGEEFKEILHADEQPIVLLDDQEAKSV